MKQSLSILFAIMLLLFSPRLQAQNKSEDVRKALTYFNNEEWRMANRLYTSLINDYPKEYKFYPYALVSRAQADSKVALVPYINQAQKSGVELDVLLSEVSSLARKVGNSDIYVRTLNELKEEQPWFANLVDRRLLAHYLFQKEYEKAKLLVATLIERFPTSLEVKRAQAELYQQSGNIYGAIEEYRSILEQNSDDLDALLYLGGHYLLTGEREIATIQERYQEVAAPTYMQHSIYRSQLRAVQDSDIANALEYLKRAYVLHSTAYIRGLLERAKQLDNIERRMQPL